MIRWGIVGCGNIAARMAGVLQKHPEAQLYACASRKGERAQSFAEAWGMDRAYVGTEALAADPRVEAIYVANIHPAHFETVKACILADKPVLCEKPMTMTSAQAEELFHLAKERDVLLMEAIWTRFLPAWRDIRNRIEKGELGRVGYMTADFSVSTAVDPNSRLFSLEKGGGALLDIGVYPLHMIQYILGSNSALKEVVGRRSSTGVDGFSAALLRFSSGAAGLMTCGFDACGSCRATIHGEKGWIEVPQMFEAREFVVHWKDRKDETKVFEQVDGFFYEIEEFHQLLKNNKLESSIAAPEHTIEILRMVEQIQARI